jgi:HAD superfamily hydrolase (TIGR01509 family)
MRPRCLGSGAFFVARVFRYTLLSRLNSLHPSLSHAVQSMLRIPDGTEALLFDCDGTLADTMPLHHAAWNEALLPYGINCPPSFIDTNAGLPAVQTVEAASRHWGVPLDAVRIAHDKEAIFEQMLHLAQPIEPVLETARGYFGKLPMGVVSGGMRRLVVQTLRGMDAEGLFSVLVTADDPVPGKPAPDVFLEAARQLGVDPARCHVFEDGDPGIVAALAAGMTVTDVRQVLAT